MNPAKTKTLYPLIAEKLNKEESDIKDLNTFYWKYIRKQLSSLVNPKIHITGLGEMNIKPWKVDPLLNVLTNKTNYHTKKNPDHPITKDYKNDLDKILSLQKLMNEEKLIAKNLKKYRLENNI